MDIVRLDAQCEHRCIVGHSILNETGVKNFISMIYDGGKRLNDDSFEIVLYNFCPGCGQELSLLFENGETGTNIKFNKK